MKTASLKRNQQRNVLAAAFKDAWKQGNLATDVSTCTCKYKL